MAIADRPACRLGPWLQGGQAGWLGHPGPVLRRGRGFSALHRLPTTEVWHFCGGDPFVLLVLRPDGSSGEVVLGPDVAGGHEVQVAVAPGTWMGGEIAPGGRFALLGCTMVPAFTSDDFEAGERAELVAAYPERAELITRLTRPDSD